MTTAQNNFEHVGNGDLRFKDETDGGFHHIALRDADDHDTIIINEDDIGLLIKRLQQHVKQHNIATVDVAFASSQESKDAIVDIANYVADDDNERADYKQFLEDGNDLRDHVYCKALVVLGLDDQLAADVEAYEEPDATDN
jgi:hypothetical protein